MRRLARLPRGFQELEWKPSTVSWLSFALLGLIVAGVGLAGTAHVVAYLEARLISHGIAHNQAVASALVPRLRPIYQGSAELMPKNLAHAVDSYKAFGFRLFIVDRQRGVITADSALHLTSPLPITQSWLAGMTDVQGIHPAPLQLGAARALDEHQHPVLIWLQAIQRRGAPRWLLGVAKDQKTLTGFLGDLRWHLDTVLLLTFVLITLLGNFALRGIGRVYERRLEARIRERTVALEASHQEVLAKTRLATIGQTASVLTHEMRNPLASIKLALSGLKESAALPERERRRVGLVLGEVDRLDRLLSETLDYVRPVQRSPQPIALDGLLNRVLHQQAPLLEAKGLLLRRETCPTCPAIHLDEPKMHQVLLNLLKNAVEASPEGGVLRVRLQREDGRLRLAIENDGESMDRETLEQAFEPFYTTKPKGSGLGLGLVKRVVEEHGGTVELTSDTAAGTRVVLSLPLGET